MKTTYPVSGSQIVLDKHAILRWLLTRGWVQSVNDKLTLPGKYPEPVWASEAALYQMRVDSMELAGKGVTA